MIIPLDHAATTPLAPEALAAMLPWLQTSHDNPASDHAGGRQARAAVETARAQVASLVGAAAADRPVAVEMGGPGLGVEAVEALAGQLDVNAAGMRSDRPVDLEEALDLVDDLVDGVSSRRNQLLMDLGTELELASIDGAADADMTALAATVAKGAPGYKAFGPVLTEAIRVGLGRLLGPSGVRASRIADRVTGTWGLGQGWVSHVTAALFLGTREGASMRVEDLASLGSSAPLTSAGAVDTLRTDTGESVYRLCSEHHHHHLVCRICGFTVEVEEPGVEVWAHRAGRAHGFTEVSHTVELFGVCARCAEAGAEPGTGSAALT